MTKFCCVQDTMCAFPLPPPPTRAASPSPFTNPITNPMENPTNDPGTDGGSDLQMMMSEQNTMPFDNIDSGAVMSPMAMFAASRTLLKDNSGDGGSAVDFLNDTPAQTPTHRSQMPEEGISVKMEDGADAGVKAHSRSPLSININASAA